MALGVTLKRIKLGEPDKLGSALPGRLARCRRMRAGSMRIVYRVNAQAIKGLVLAIGQHRFARVCVDAEKQVW